MNKSLKGCPFCGRTPKVLHRTDSLDGYFCAISCFCGGCSARAHQAATGADESEAYMKAALRWNRRPEPESKPLTLEELRERAGKPVWISGINRWGVVGKRTDCRMAIGFVYGWEWLDDVLRGRYAYDRPPGEGVL